MQLMISVSSSIFDHFLCSAWFESPTVLSQKMSQIVISSSYGDITRKCGNSTHIPTHIRKLGLEVPIWNPYGKALTVRVLTVIMLNKLGSPLGWYPKSTKKNFFSTKTEFWYSFVFWFRIYVLKSSIRSLRVSEGRLKYHYHIWVLYIIHVILIRRNSSWKLFCGYLQS